MRKAAIVAAVAQPSVASVLDGLSPLEYMLGVMNNQATDELRRDRMAIAAAPFCHAKAGEEGKKGARQNAAAKASVGKFAPAAPPRLVVNNK